MAGADPASTYNVDNLVRTFSVRESLQLVSDGGIEVVIHIT